MRNECSPHDRVDGCPHKQQGSVGWAPGHRPQAVAPTRHPMRGQEPDQDGPQVGQGHKDGPLRPHSPRGGKIWGGREHANGEPLPQSFPCVSHVFPPPVRHYSLAPHRRSRLSPCLDHLPSLSCEPRCLAPFLVSTDLFSPHLAFGTRRDCLVVITASELNVPLLQRV